MFFTCVNLMLFGEAVAVNHDLLLELTKCISSSQLVNEMVSAVLNWCLAESQLDFTDDAVPPDEVEGDVLQAANDLVLDLNDFEVFNGTDHLISIHHIVRGVGRDHASNHVSHSERTVFFKFVLLDLLGNSCQVPFHTPRNLVRSFVEGGLQSTHEECIVFQSVLRQEVSFVDWLFL